MNPVNLTQQEAVKKLKELIEDIDICMFCTNLKTDDGSTARPMSTQGVDDNGDIWFFSSKNSNKERQVQQDSHVQLFYSHPGKSSYLVVSGKASLSNDRKKIEELWKPHVKAWFQGGKDDPNIELIRVSDINAYYWDTKGNQMINFFKMAASVVTGKTLIDAEEGSININK